ncbi:glycosyltransferase family 4 protein [Phenylobacterium deserti]|uniref:Uncharacterized protein n=1 Tax=Phenylobacterium deserti TaxID=1914756 RepID=A0A328AQQ1_9CAUL|nr:glycosyltransferase family 4 protein [Phenylobacterium deserti]RAK57353.1 hypothetical protein DJ018_05275 [Phenylobacterium deserti]
MQRNLVAFRFEPDGYDLKGPKLMGRQAAGNGFLRAAVAARGDAPLIGYGPSPQSGEAFAQLVREIDPAASTAWLDAMAFDQFAQIGVCHRPDAALVAEAQLRLRTGPGRYSLTGVTHTLSTRTMMDGMAAYAAAPLEPWDAVVCTSRSAVSVIETVLAEQRDYLAWRFGAQIPPSGPQLPVIPLGVHATDFVIDDEARAAARAGLNIAEGETVALFAGRLAFSDKAHPFAMFAGLEAVAARTGRKITLLLAGKFPARLHEEAFRTGVLAFCPSVRVIFVDGANALAYRQGWRAADLFVSLADSIQETFGLTPLEAMAAGLPVVVSDWDGYRETVRDGIDGFRIRTLAPEAGSGELLAAALESETYNAGRFAWRTAVGTFVDLDQLIDRLTALVEQPELRRRLGASGQARARAEFDWAVVYRQYQALWRELNARRQAVVAEPSTAARLASAPRGYAGRIDPYRLFGHYPTEQITAATRFILRPGADGEAFARRSQHTLFLESFAPPERALLALQRLAAGPATVAQIAAAAGASEHHAILLCGSLGKMGLIAAEAA